MKISVLAAVILFLLCALAAAGATRRNGSVVILRSADSIVLDPARSTDGESGRVIAQIYEGLVKYKDDSTDIEPCLAEAWDISDDGCIWTFQLRQGVRFHDGTPFNAEAVAFSFLRQIDPRHPHHRDDFKYAGFAFKYVKSIEVVGSYTVKIVLEKPFAPFLCNLRMRHGAPIISPTALATWGDEFFAHPVGTGPFRLVEWIPGDQIVLEKNPDYWGKKPLVDKLIFRTIPNAQQRFKEFQDGRADVLDGMNIIDVPKINQLPDSLLLRQPGLNVAYLAMNTEKPPFDRVNIRRAINHAINKQNLIKLYYQDLAIPAKSPLPPYQWGHNDRIEDYAYNPEKARELLTLENSGQGFETTLWYFRSSRPYMPESEKIAVAIKANLGAVGIQVRLVGFEWGEYLSRTANGEHDMCLIGWNTDNGDPDNYLYVLLDSDNAVKPHANNRAFFRHQQLHELLIKAQQTFDKRQRIELYHAAQDIIHAEAPWVPLAHVQDVIAVRKSLRGLAMHPSGALRFDSVWKE